MLGLGLLLAPFIIFHRLRLERDALKEKLDDREERQRVAGDIAEFISQGSALRGRLQRVQDIDSFTDVQQEILVSWPERVCQWLRQEPLLKGHDALFMNEAGLPSVDLSGTRIFLVDRRGDLPDAWDALTYVDRRLQRLKQIRVEVLRLSEVPPTSKYDP